MEKVVTKVGLAVDSDLSNASIEAARDQIHNLIDFSLPLSYDYYVLRVASQNMGTAFILRLHGEFTLDIDFTYQPDEWSLHYFRMVKDNTPKLQEYIVHTEGA